MGLAKRDIVPREESLERFFRGLLAVKNGRTE
jgi:hypothetical protein